jgi:hypothetical protein
MFEDFNKINSGFKKGFSSVYYAKVRCPVCKEEIFANALACPNCKTDFTKEPYNKRTTWQGGAMKIVLIISALVGISICLSDTPIIFRNNRRTCFIWWRLCYRSENSEF